jgi:DNA (cytosine-5)-methyltransferase 1
VTLTVGSLFSGIGGLDLGLERAGMEVRWQCEIDPYCQQVLEKHWPEVKRYDDVRRIRGEEVGYTDVLAGGFPCQDVSHAAAEKRRGMEHGTRSGLWREYARLIGEIEPRWVIIENVRGLLSIDDGRGGGRVLHDLARLGYDAEWEIIQANWFGLPHIRERVFIVAYPERLGRRVLGPESIEHVRPIQQRFNRSAICAPGGPGHTEGSLAEGIRERDGIPARLDAVGRRLGMMGNAVSPQVAEYIGRCIMSAEVDA